MTGGTPSKAWDVGVSPFFFLVLHLKGAGLGIQLNGRARAKVKVPGLISRTERSQLSPDLSYVFSRLSLSLLGSWSMAPMEMEILPEGNSTLCRSSQSSENSRTEGMTSHLSCSSIFQREVDKRLGQDSRRDKAWFLLLHAV